MSFPLKTDVRGSQHKGTFVKLLSLVTHISFAPVAIETKPATTTVIDAAVDLSQRRSAQVDLLSDETEFITNKLYPVCLWKIYAKQTPPPQITC